MKIGGRMMLAAHHVGGSENTCRCSEIDNRYIHAAIVPIETE